MISPRGISVKNNLETELLLNDTYVGQSSLKENKNFLSAKKCLKMSQTFQDHRPIYTNG